MPEPYRPGRDGRFEYAFEAIDYIERTSCAKGCTVPTPADIKAFGPGGCCPILATIAIGDPVEIPEIEDHGRFLRCVARQPLPPKVKVLEPTQDGPDLFGGAA